MTDLAVIDVGPLVARTDTPAGADQRAAVGRAIDAACRDTGFFTITGHGVDPERQERLDRLAREFFGLDEDEKAEIAMARGGRAWRGWFPVGAELTAGVPDRKEGLYFGAELAPPVDGRPLQGPNLFPARPAGLRSAVLGWVDAMTTVGHALAGGLALALGHDEGWFAEHLTADPTVLFRIFHYPPTTTASGAGSGTPGYSHPRQNAWGAGEHTDYGLLTILAQDGSGGLEVRTPEGWIDVPPEPGAFVCNLGDMLERLCGGRYRSTPHRVRNRSSMSRLSFPFFFDPSWDAVVDPDGGTYGDYLLAKVSKVFPALGSEVLDEG